MKLGTMIQWVGRMVACIVLIMLTLVVTAAGPLQKVSAEHLAQANEALPQVFVNVAGLNLRAGPAVTYPIIGSYPMGTVLTFLGTSADKEWYKVSLRDPLNRPNGSDKVGWMKQDYLLPVEPLLSGVLPLGTDTLQGTELAEPCNKTATNGDSLQKALNACNKGGSIRLQAGTYTPKSPLKRFTVPARNYPTRLVIAGPANRKAIFRRPSSTPNERLFSIPPKASHVTLRNVTFTECHGSKGGTRNAGGPTCLVVDGTDIRIERNDFLKCLDCDFMSGSGDTVIVTGNKFQDAMPGPGTTPNNSCMQLYNMCTAQGKTGDEFTACMKKCNHNDYLVVSAGANDWTISDNQFLGQRIYGAAMLYIQGVCATGQQEPDANPDGEVSEDAPTDINREPIDHVIISNNKFGLTPQASSVTGDAAIVVQRGRIDCPDRVSLTRVRISDNYIYSKLSKPYTYQSSIKLNIHIDPDKDKCEEYDYPWIENNTVRHIDQASCAQGIWRGNNHSFTNPPGFVCQPTSTSCPRP